MSIADVTQKNFRKAITDAPNLRGDRAHCCANCKYARRVEMRDELICDQFQFQTDNELVCDAWETIPAPEPTPVQIIEPMDAGGMDAEKTLVMFGDSVKALGNGRVGGYLVRFTPRGDYDLESERFDAHTDFGDATKSDSYYQHGLDAMLGKRVLGKAELRRDDAGIWAELQLQLRDEYEKMIYALAEKNKLGWSSGTASHLVERVAEGKGYYIKRWVLGLDASLTPTPAEPRNGVMSIKRLLAEREHSAGQTDEVVAKTATSGADAVTRDAVEKSDSTDDYVRVGDMPTHEENKMENTNESKTAPQTDKVAELEKQFGELKAKIENAPATNGGAPAVKRVTERGFKDDEVKSFLHWIRTGDDKAYKAAMQEDTDSEGGYAVPKDFAAQIAAKRNEVSIIRQTGVVPLQTSLEHYLFPTEGTAATKAIVTAEEAAYDENEPTLAQVDVVAYKHTKLIKISEELEADAKANFGGWLSNVFARAFGLAENYAAFNIASNGSSKPASVTYGATTTTAVASQTAFTAAELLSLIYAVPSAYSDNLAMVMRRTTLGAIRALSGNPFSFIPTPDGAGTANSAPGLGGYIHGIPVYLTDDLPAQAAANKPVVIFNPDFYGMVEREGFSVSRNPYLYQANGQIGLFAKARFGGALLQAEAAYVLVSKT